MSITDELRDWAKEHLSRSSILAIADRIDAKHEETIASVMNDALYHANDKDMADLGWYRALDADNQPIHVGDMMEWVRYEDDDPTIVRTVSGIGNGIFFAWSDEQGRYAQYKANAYRHHHTPTVEDVLREFALAVCKDDALTIRKGVVDEYAAKLQLREDA